MSAVEILSSRVILRPADYDVTLAFYRDTLGLGIAREYPGGTVFFAGQSLIEIAAHGASGTPSTFDGALWLQVRDVHEVAARVDVDRGPTTEPWGLIEMWTKDPDGVPIVFVQIPDDHPLRRDQRR